MTKIKNKEKKADVCPKCGMFKWKNITNQENARLGPFEMDFSVYRQCENCGLKQQGSIF